MTFVICASIVFYIRGAENIEPLAKALIAILCIIYCIMFLTECARLGYEQHPNLDLELKEKMSEKYKEMKEGRNG